jgi:hypothetical protein
MSAAIRTTRASLMVYYNSTDSHFSICPRSLPEIISLFCLVLHKRYTGFSKLSSFWKEKENIKGGYEITWLSVCVCVSHLRKYRALCACMCNLSIVARQRLGKHVHAAMNSHAIVQLLNASFSVRSETCKWRVVDYFFPELLVISVVPLWSPPTWRPDSPFTKMNPFLMPYFPYLEVLIRINRLLSFNTTRIV